jgi:hypothetical protein
MTCIICNTNNDFIFKESILNKYDIKYYHCQNCGFLQTEEPYWLEESYAESINISDTGYMQRNVNLSRKLTVLLSILFKKDAKFLDYAGGYGVFVRLMRDIGFDFYWDDKFTSNLFARGFEYKHENIDAITTFESFEHFVNPLHEIEKMLSISKTIIFSTELLPNPIPKPKDWWYYGLDHGQHISFYGEKTLHFIAKKYSLNYYNCGAISVFTDRQLPEYLKYILKFTRFGLHKILEKRYSSKAWEDHVKVCKQK